MPSTRQIARLYTLAHRAGLTRADVHGELEARLGITSSKLLSSSAYEGYTADLLRRSRPSAPPYRPGSYASAEDLRDFAAASVRFGLLWLDQGATEDDVALLTHLLNDWRLYRVRTQRLSQKQLDALLSKLNAVPLPVFRAAAAIWLERYRMKNEDYFFGVCQHVQADARRQVQPAFALL